MTTKHSDHTVTAAQDGTELYVQTWTPPDAPPKAQVLIIHGYLEHSGRYGEVAEALCHKDIRVTAFDLRGHGKSCGERGYIKTWNDYHVDVQTALATLDTDIPCFVLGHSNGGLLALDYFHDNNLDHIKGLVITSPFLKAADDLGCFKMCLSKVLGCLLPRLSLPADVKSQDLTHDADIIKANDEDPLVLKEFTLSWAVHGMAAQKRVLAQTTSSYPLPILFAYACDDKISDAETNEQFAAAIQQDDKTVIPRKNDYHEVLNETDRKELYGTITEWILERS